MENGPRFTLLVFTIFNLKIKHVVNSTSKEYFMEGRPTGLLQLAGVF